MPAPPGLSDEEASALQAIAGHVAPPAARTVPTAARGEDLIAAVLARPDDDEALEIYRDHLLEKGDPRGELIALQRAPSLDDAGERRLRALRPGRG